MDEKSLRNLSLACAAFGLLLLYLISNFTEPSARSLSSITIDDVGSRVMACGQIADKRVTKAKHIFFTINDNSTDMTFVIFNSSSIKLSGTDRDPFVLNRTQGICFEAIVDEWPKGSGQLELVYRGGSLRAV